jgi:hypothetical protein
LVAKGLVKIVLVPSVVDSSDFVTVKVAPEMLVLCTPCAIMPYRDRIESASPTPLDSTLAVLRFKTVSAISLAVGILPPAVTTVEAAD